MRPASNQPAVTKGGSKGGRGSLTAGLSWLATDGVPGTRNKGGG